MIVKLEAGEFEKSLKILTDNLTQFQKSTGETLTQLTGKLQKTEELFKAIEELRGVSQSIDADGSGKSDTKKDASDGKSFWDGTAIAGVVKD